MIALNLIILSFLSFCCVLAEEPKFLGECPTVPTAKSFDYKKFAGLWYEIKRYPNTIHSEQCAIANYILLNYNNYNITYLSRDLDKKQTTKRELVIDKEIVKSNDIRYDVYFKCQKDAFQHLVLDTDYNGYSVIWGCIYDKETNQNSQRLFIYSRKNSLDAANLQKIEKLLKDHKIGTDKLEDVEQKTEKCGSLIAQPPIFTGCPNESCKDFVCAVP